MTSCVHHQKCTAPRHSHFFVKVVVEDFKTGTFIKFSAGFEYNWNGFVLSAAKLINYKT